MIRNKKVTIEVDEIIALICDKCGREYAQTDLETQEFHQISFTGGYNSVFEDGTKVECDLCQYCLHEIIGNICRKDTV